MEDIFHRPMEDHVTHDSADLCRDLPDKFIPVNGAIGLEADFDWVWGRMEMEFLAMDEFRGSQLWKRLHLGQQVGEVIVFRCPT
jgi:hypothetical protein